MRVREKTTYNLFTELLFCPLFYNIDSERVCIVSAKHCITVHWNVQLCVRGKVQQTLREDCVLLCIFTASRQDLGTASHQHCCRLLILLHLYFCLSYSYYQPCGFTRGGSRSSFSVSLSSLCLFYVVCHDYYLKQLKSVTQINLLYPCCS